MRVYERALEVLVALLIGAAGISVVVGAYEATNHRSAAIWWTLAVGGLVAAVWLVVIWLGVHPLFLWGSGWTAKWRERAAASRASARDRSRAAATTRTGFHFVAAVYGTPDRSCEADVTARLNDLIRGNRIDFTANNETLGGDPCPDLGKTLSVEFEVDGETFTNTFAENTPIVLP